MDTFTTIPTKADETLPPTNADGGGGTSGQCVVSKEDVTLPPTNADGGGGTSGQSILGEMPSTEVLHGLSDAPERRGSNGSLRPVLVIRLPSASFTTPDSAAASHVPLSPLSPATPTSAVLAAEEDTKRRRKVAKLTWMLGENVPAELAFGPRVRRRSSVTSALAFEGRPTRGRRVSAAATSSTISESVGSESDALLKGV
ncbi:hypothetical protein FB45DRAFT_1034101 [Roridomyces roridus]|uniref:Uncharacterized protein n=1 Tax=Roridomyces roridus TaxID=1738132 RepID=A0AAD7BDJ9_9AGAR|nr:hypothetical protein FB45DRAFT_1034101 [Roridomyces roridus]